MVLPKPTSNSNPALGEVQDQVVGVVEVGPISSPL